MNLNDLSPAALSAAMRAGTDGWGAWASASEHIRYAQPIRAQSRRRCPCCKRRATHTGACNGLVMMFGCELRVARWVRG